MKEMFFWLFCCCLLGAALEDHRYMRVRRCIWYVAGLSGVGMMCVSGILQEILRGERWGMLLDLLCFGMLQMRFFSKMYGRADSYAFTCCSFVLAACDGGMTWFLLHMLLAVCFLGVLQLLRGNVGRNGNLRRPVAFVPYIGVAFLTCLFLKDILGNGLF